MTLNSQPPPFPKKTQSLYSGSNVILATAETYYESTPRIDEVGCAAYEADDESLQLLETPLLPDLSAVVDEQTQEKVWAFKGEERISVASAGGDGTVLALLWEARARHGEKETVYRFWAAAESGGKKNEAEIDNENGELRGTKTAKAAAAAADPPPPPSPLLLRPLRLHQSGPDILSGSHFDEYVVDYGELVPGPPPASSFEKPESCVGVEVKDRGAGPRRKSPSARLAATAASVAPRLPCSERSRKAAAALLLSAAGAAVYTPAAPSAFEENAAFVARHNSGGASSSSPSSLLSSSASPPAPSYRVELNRFAALSDAQFAATYLQGESLAARRQRRKEEKEENDDDKDDNDDDENEQLLSSQKKNKKKKKKKKPFSAELPYARRVPKGRVPSSVDWRATGAVPSAVKDQSTCGSCWAFGTAAALEGASFSSSGRSFSVSEQQFMDCSWDFGANSACGGGDADAALDWLVKERGGEFDVEGDYQYRGAAGFCQKLLASSSSLNSSSPSSSPVRVRGYAFVPKGDDEALMEAVYSRGPLQVSIDAAAKGFRFYSSGVYDEPSCSPKEEDLDHSVALVGYGTDEGSGKDYWLVRNSW